MLRRDRPVPDDANRDRPVIAERDVYRLRIDVLLDELTAQRVLLAACTEMGGGDPVLLGEVQHLADECMEENARLHKTINTLRQFINASKATDYRPYAWELELILGGV